MRCNNQLVETKRASQGWMATKATSNNNEDEDHDDAGTLKSKIKLCNTREDNDDDATMPGLSREGVEVKTEAAVSVVGTVAMVAADDNRNGAGRQQSQKCSRQWQRGRKQSW
jgi:hypothetical protein